MSTTVSPGKGGGAPTTDSGCQPPRATQGHSLSVKVIATPATRGTHASAVTTNRPTHSQQPVPCAVPAGRRRCAPQHEPAPISILNHDPFVGAPSEQEVRPPRDHSSPLVASVDRPQPYEA